MSAESDYQQALKDIASLAKREAARVTRRPAAKAIDQLFRKYGGTIAAPLIADLKAGAWKKWESWQLGGAMSYLGSFATSDAVAPLRDIEQNYPVADIQTQAKELADLLATLDVAVSEAKQLAQVQDAIKGGNTDEMARAMLLALAKIDPDWPVRASAIQKDLYRLSADSFPAINELAAGKLSQADVTKALVEILFRQFLGKTSPP